MKEKQDEQVTTTVQMSAGVLKRAKKTAESVGASQSSFFRFAITTAIVRIERGDMNHTVDPAAIEKLRQLPAFVDYAQEKMNSSVKNVVRIQRTPEGRLLGCAGMMLYRHTRRFEMAPLWQPSNSDEPLRTIANKYHQQPHDFAVTVGGSDYLLGASNNTLVRMLKKRWQKKPLIRLCVALFLWFLRKLLDWS